MRLCYPLMVCLALLNLPALGQKIVYSDPEKDDSRKMNFEIIGKVSGNFLIFKSNHGKSTIAVLITTWPRSVKKTMIIFPMTV